jgi:uncharacterized protein YndB with AHSA1/START domain
MENTIKTNIDASAEHVWEALTNPDLIRKYFFGTNTETDWKPGSPVKFSGEWEGKTYVDKGTVIEAEPQKKLKYNYWSSMSGIEDKPENYANITYTLEEKNGTTLLTVHQDNIPDEKTREHSEANWKMVLKQLKQLLEKDHVQT